MALYYWYNKGRLGNLLLQFAALEHLTNDGDTIICFNTELFNALTPGKKYLRIPRLKYVVPNFNHYVNKFVDYLSNKNWISSIQPAKFFYDNTFEDERFDIVRTDGLLKNIVIVKGYFQHDKWIIDFLRYNLGKVDIAKGRLEKLSKSRCKVAVHVRLTDYKEWVVLGKKDASISYEWYEKAMDYARERLDNPDFIFFSDDEAGLKNYGFQLPLKFFKGCDAIEELIALSLCEHAIISPSSFAYCSVLSSYYNGKLIIAPEFWAGFKSKVWFPATIKSTKIYYLEVK